VIYIARARARARSKKENNIKYRKKSTSSTSPQKNQLKISIYLLLTYHRLGESTVRWTRDLVITEAAGWEVGGGKVR
jgi:hypothetical protein